MLNLELHDLRGSFRRRASIDVVNLSRLMHRNTSTAVETPQEGHTPELTGSCDARAVK